MFASRFLCFFIYRYCIYNMLICVYLCECSTCVCCSYFRCVVVSLINLCMLYVFVERGWSQATIIWDPSQKWLHFPEVKSHGFPRKTIYKNVVFPDLSVSLLEVVVLHLCGFQSWAQRVYVFSWLDQMIRDRTTHIFG